MERFLESIEASIAAKNWFGALFLALALPDICGALETPDDPVGERYKRWFQQHLRPKYAPASIYELLMQTAPEQLEQMPTEVVERFKVQAPPAGAAFTADDCYRLRCRCLHQGLAVRMSEQRIYFSAPDPTGQRDIHRNSINGVLQLSIDVFCADVVQAVRVWWRQAKELPDVVARVSLLISVHSLDDPNSSIIRTV